MGEEEIKRLDDEAREAFLRGDVATLQRLLSEDFVVTNPFNRVLGKRQVVEALESGRIKHSVYEREIEVLRLYGDTAVVMGRETVVDEAYSKDRRYTEVWQRREGRWQMVARHANEVCA
jgi:ketosteroid isomerase-like protein